MFFSSGAMFFPIGVCLLATVILVAVLRRGPLSLGLPFAYCILLLLNHLPGAWVNTIRSQSYGQMELVKTGITIAAIGVCSFVGGVWIARKTLGASSSVGNWRQMNIALEAVPQRFLIFSLLGGWFLTFVIQVAINVPSINAIVEKGSAIWLLAVLIGLAKSVKRRSLAGVLLWVTALLIYPTFVLVVGGFASWGSASIIMVISVFSVITKYRWRVFLATIVVGVLSLSLFVNYFAIRKELRSAAWGGAPISERASVAMKIFTNLRLVSIENSDDYSAINKRLNQNYFIGVAAERLDSGQAEYLWGRSIWEGAIALVPRVFWPGKPVFGGSGTIVSDITGLSLESQNTSWGVGSVMEFYINFGFPGLIFGMLILGFIISRLDAQAASKLASRNYGQSFVYFLPCVALIQPLGSMVELSGGAMAALLSSLAWRWGWMQFSWTKSQRRLRQEATANTARSRLPHASRATLPGRQPYDVTR